MPRGGHRPGAGRKPGQSIGRTNKTNELAKAAAGEGVLPLEVMLRAMRKYFADGDLAAAAEVARAAAPYLHCRMPTKILKRSRIAVALVYVDDFYRSPTIEDHPPPEALPPPDANPP